MPLVNPHSSIEDGHVDVGDGHSLYWKRFGNKNGVPVIMLHGGPGNGMDEYLSAYFDLKRTNLLMFDQRGAGKSLANGSLAANTTSALVDDCAHMMGYHSFDRAVVVGGSWGATLAIEFAKKYRSLCSQLIVYSAFLGRPEDEAWFLNGAQTFFPDYWQRLVAGFSNEEKGNIAKAYQARLDAANLEQARILTAQFLTYAGRLSFLTVEKEERMISAVNVTDAQINSLKLFLHYSTNEYFLGREGVLRDIDLLSGLPGAIIHGRYDMDSPVVGAYALACAWPNASFQVVPVCGHSDREPEMRKALSLLFNNLVI